jgi:RHS repeat-associated protein
LLGRVASSSQTTDGVSAQRRFTCDAAGNVTSDGGHTYVYDADNRVASVDSGAYTYGYDHQNRRVKKAGGVLTHYLWEGSDVIAEYNGSTGAQQVIYFYAGSRLVAKDVGLSRRFFLSDRLSVRLALDGSGNAVGRQGHLPFGEDMAGSGEQDKHRFTSYDRDAETGLDYAVNRYDNTNIGRFAAVDPKASSTRRESPLHRFARPT